MQKITIEEVLEIFLRHTIYDIKQEKETPNINFDFNKESLIIFKKIAYNQEDIDFLIEHSHDECITIKIDNSLKFFNYLTDIINETYKLFIEYEDNVDMKETAIYLLRRIWLRMGINDIENINIFLENQLQFIKNRTFDNPNPQKISNFKEYDVIMRTKTGDLWDETTRHMIFTLKKDNEMYELPHILYDINNEGICYIYAIQSSQSEKSKRIERKLYTLNKNIDNPNIHPSKVCSLLLFIKQLKSRNITQIVIPSMQVLSYHYHELLSVEAKKMLDEIIEEKNKYPADRFIKDRYEYLKNWYNHVYQKQDIISYLKTEELINLIYRITKHDTNIEIINELNIQGDSLIIKIRKKTS